MVKRSGRLRLVVIQALVFALFVTLFARLYYLQVVGGEEYHAQAASQSVREIVVQPQRGLIVDDLGRPLVANRTSWVVSVDRSMLAKMTEHQQEVLVGRLSDVVDVPRRAILEKLVTCGDPGSVAGTCWNGSPYQPVPVASDVKQAVALRILEQPEDYPAILAEQQSVRAYPAPYGINLAHVLGYLSPITESEYDRATEDGDKSVNGASSVGRAGVEKEYDRWLRGMPGYKSVAVDSMGRVLGDDSEVAGQPGDTLVTSIDAKVQGVVEKQLAETIATARATRDTVTGRNYAADSGAAIVMEADTGRIVAMASQPTYDPSVWVGGITKKQLARLYSEAAGTPLLGRATQGQFAPGSTWKPFMTAGALTHGFSEDTRLNCSSSFRVGNRDFKNYESGAYGYIGFDKALEVSCNTFFYRVGYSFWQKYGSDVADVNAKDPLVSEAKTFGFGSETGIDLPGEASGRIADRKWKRAYYSSMKDYYCGIADKPQDADTSDFVYQFSREFCVEGYAYRAGDAVNFAIGQGDTIVTPLQLTRAYAALANGGTLYAPRVGKAIVAADGTLIREIKPKKVGTVDLPKRVLGYIDTALKGVTRQGTMAWRMGGFPLDDVVIRSKTGSAEVYGKQSTSWVASYSDDYVVVMMVSQGGTGSGTSGPAVRKIWEALYGVDGMDVEPSKAAIPGTTPPAGLPTFMKDGTILPPAEED
ncbi:MULTISPECIES: penicillin-binding protein 2 [unclassified Nocardioides]|uniref:penicillin-binding protein 2 n=1 Tax=unclassified Nocardioides TaxID=2615069 RepID=UPI0009EFDC93|nr:MULTISPECIES: penicillin-binding protein 2 [unclassified Nocardioides]GAW47834.1 peptidoglycan glycosyltransferase [Nocardioides sp. PD653-B2]GAW53532.1 peptidoglycan glycosyltransferase [Nocardioides sp. PD653]